MTSLWIRQDFLSPSLCLGAIDLVRGVYYDGISIIFTSMTTWKDVVHGRHENKRTPQACCLE
jgi:hypothetical protein